MPMTRAARRVTACVFAVAFATCPAIEPAPNGPEPVMRWWLAAVDIAAIAAICVAVVTLWRGARRAPALGVVAGVGMVVETALCPISGHHVVGWWTWVQACLSFGVLATSVALVTVERRVAVEPAVAVPFEPAPALPADVPTEPRDDVQIEALEQPDLHMIDSSRAMLDAVALDAVALDC